MKRATIDIVRLDDALRERFFELQGRVGAVKMDVEGYEPLVRKKGGMTGRWGGVWHVLFARWVQLRCMEQWMSHS